MGVVYKVEHAQIGKLMALKLLTGELTRDEELVSRFKREALMASRLSHPNTVQVFDFGSSDGLTYLAMEFLNGEDLGKALGHGPFDSVRAGKIMIQACSSLAEAHELSIVHRDLKPENIFLMKGRSGDDVIKVLDFGLAKLRESSELAEVTTGGAIVGTPFYMSPEQIRGEDVDPRSDIYSLGAVLCTCLTGRPPFDAPTPMGILTKHLTEPPPYIANLFPDLGISAGMSRIVYRSLSKEPEDRPQSVQALQQAIVDEIRGNTRGSVDNLLDSTRVRKVAKLAEDAATRDEVAMYERKLRRRGLMTWLGVGAFAVGVGGAIGWRLWQAPNVPVTVEGTEQEPNDKPGAANPVAFGSEVKGKLGRRLNQETSDRDFFAVTIGEEPIEVSTTSLPNMALCVWVYPSGAQQPVGRYCAGNANRDLVIPALQLEAGDYLFAVMQDQGRYTAAPPPPVYENVSDNYTFRVSEAALVDGVEIEPNDAPSSGRRVKIGEKMSGRLTWMRDEDVVCATGSGKFRFVVEDGTKSARPAPSVLQATPIGGPADGIPVRIHHGSARGDANPMDTLSPWKGPVTTATRGTDACLRLALAPNPWAPTPHPHIAPASDDEYLVHVEPVP